MAHLEVTNARIRLNPAERRMVERNLEDLVVVDSQQRTATLSANFKRRARFRNRLQRTLRQVSLKPDALRESTNAEFTSLDRDRVRRARRARRLTRRRRAGRPQTIWGLTSGVERPPHDFTWTHHDIDGTPLDFATEASAATGHLRAYATATTVPRRRSTRMQELVSGTCPTVQAT
jgi:hypothetical protein